MTTDLATLLRSRLGLADPAPVDFQRGDVKQADGFERTAIEYRGLEGDVIPAFLFTPTLPQSTINMLVPVAAAALVLAVALSAYVMVKFYGVVFLGRPREPHLAYAHDAGRRERAALALLAAGCILLGLFPAWTIAGIDHVNGMLLATTVSRAGESSWLPQRSCRPSVRLRRTRKRRRG